MSTVPVFPAERIVQILEETKAACPHQWSTAHTDSAERYDFIIAAVKRLDAASGGSVGGNWRRGVVGDLSMDGISVAASDGRYHFIDVIINAGASNARLKRANEIRLSDATTLRAIRNGVEVYIHADGFVPARHLPKAVVTCGATVPVDPPVDPPKPPVVSREQFAKDFTAVNAFYASSDGLQRVGGMVSNVDASAFAVLREAIDRGEVPLVVAAALVAVLQLQCDVQAMIQWGYDLTSGRPLADVLAAIKASDEWRSKHP